MSCLELAGAELEGGNHSIPKCYGAIQPTAVFVPLKEMLSSDDHFAAATAEIFDPCRFDNGGL